MQRMRLWAVAHVRVRRGTLPCTCGLDLTRFGERGADPLALLRGVSVLRVSLFESTWRGLSRYPVGSVATSFEQANLGKKPVAPALLH